LGDFHGAVHNHQRLRAREDGEKPSPPRDCKAEFFSAHHCLKQGIATRVAIPGERWEGRAAARISSSFVVMKSRQAAKPGDRRSLNPDTQAPEAARASFGQPSTPAREGEGEK